MHNNYLDWVPYGHFNVVTQIGDQNEAPTVIGHSVPRSGQRVGPDTCLPVSVSPRTEDSQGESTLCQPGTEPSPRSSPALTLNLDFWLPGLRHSRQGWPQRESRVLVRRAVQFAPQLRASSRLGPGPCKGEALTTASCPST